MYCYLLSRMEILHTYCHSSSVVVGVLWMHLFWHFDQLSNPLIHDCYGLLSQVWAIADVKRQGFLGFKEFVSAMQVADSFYRFHGQCSYDFPEQLLLKNLLKTYKRVSSLQVISLLQSGNDIGPDILKNAGNLFYPSKIHHPRFTAVGLISFVQG